MFSWKDIRHPLAGGAELFTWEVLRRLAKMGHRVFWFASKVRGLPGEERLENVRIERSGGTIGVYHASIRKAVSIHREFEVCIDQVNTRPFFCHSRVSAQRHFVLVHELARDSWNTAFPPPISWIGRYVLEPVWLRAIRHLPTITVSRSTAKDLHECGFRSVRIVPEGCSIEPFSVVPRKEARATFAFLGLMKKTNLPQHAIEAFLEIRTRIDSQLWLMGHGKLLSKLKKRYQDPDIKFLGHVSEEEKRGYLSRAHLVLMPAVREGWGLVVTEANACGTPVLAYDVPGLRDSVQPGVNGILVDPLPDRLAQEAIDLMLQPDRLQSMCTSALLHAKTYNWDRAAVTMEEALRPGEQW